MDRVEYRNICLVFNVHSPSSPGLPEGYNADWISQPVAIKPQVLKPVVIEVVSIRISKLLLKLQDWHYKVMIR